MPISVTNTTGGATSYADIRIGDGHAIHQIKLDASELTGARDAAGVLPVGLPLQADGSPIDADGQVCAALVGPEAIPITTTIDIFGNAIFGGLLNKNMIEDNLGRALSADEITAIAANPALILR